MHFSGIYLTHTDKAGYFEIRHKQSMHFRISGIPQIGKLICRESPEDHDNFGEAAEI